MHKGNTTPENKDYKQRAQNKEKKLSSKVIHSVNMRRTSDEIKSDANLLGRDGAWVSVNS